MTLRNSNRALALFLLLVSLLVAQPAHAQRAVPGDYDGDRRSDIVVARKLGLYWFWFVRLATGQEVQPQIFGLSASDTLLAGDWDGDGDFAPAVVRSNNGFLYLYTMRNDGSADELQWGLVGDTIVTVAYGVRDYYGVVRNQEGYLHWYLGGEPFIWGLNGDSVFAGDFSGDGNDEPVVAREMLGGYTWFVRDNPESPTIIQWGLSGDTPLKPYDFDRDGKDDLIVVRSAAGALVAHIRLTGENGAAKGTQSITFGLTGDTPFIGSFNLETQGEFGVYRKTTGGISRHYVNGLGVMEQRVDFGLEGDTLVRPDGTTASPSVSGGGGASSGLAAVCPVIIPVSSGTLWKPSSDHSGPPRVGKPLIVFSRNKPSGSCLRGYASNGTEVTRLGLYEYNGKYGARYYTGWGCGDQKDDDDIETAATAASGSPEIYVSKNNGTCVGPIMGTDRDGSL